MGFEPLFENAALVNFISESYFFFVETPNIKKRINKILRSTTACITKVLHKLVICNRFLNDNPPSNASGAARWSFLPFPSASLPLSLYRHLTTPDTSSRLMMPFSSCFGLIATLKLSVNNTAFILCMLSSQHTTAM